MLYLVKALGGKTMKKRKDSRIVLSILMVGVLLFSMFTITGCGKKTIVGVWVSESDGEKIYFNDDGTCDNMPYQSYYEFVKYKVLGDDNIVFYDEWKQKHNVKVVDSAEKAKSELYSYYLDDDVLILYENTYNRE